MTKPNMNQQAAEQSGLVISYFGSSVAVEADDGQVFQCHLRRNQELPVVGDRVRWQLDAKDNTGVILAIEPRRSILARGEAHGKSKPLAANVDRLVIVMAPPPIFSEHLVDRYLVAAELLKIQPILVINKRDLLAADALQKTEEQLMPYRHIPYPVLFTSAVTNAGLTELANELSHKTSVLMGPSGVGKSSIIGHFVNIDIPVRDVSPKGAGKHTTTATRLYHLPEGGCLIDSPGLRDFSLWQISPTDVLGGFKEFQAFLTGCRFRDCHHLAEPGCAVQAAISDGKINPLRYESYKELMKQANSYKKY